MRVLGVVEWVSTAKSGHRVAGLRPLFDMTAATWREIDSDVEFPTEGLAIWHQAQDVRQAEFILCRAEENSNQKYQYKVADHREILEVIDLRKVGPPEYIRQALLAGFQWPGFVPSRGLLWCDGDLLIGPVTLHIAPHGVLSVEHPHRDRIPVYRGSTLDIRQIAYDGIRRFVLASPSLGAPSSYVDWDNDRFAIRRAITWAADRAKEHGIDHGLTRRLIEETAQYFTKPGTSAELNLEEYRLQRALQIIADVQRVEAIARLAVEALQSHPMIARELEQLCEESRKIATAEVREAMRDEREALHMAQQEREHLIAEIQAAQAQRDELHARIDAEVQEVETEITRRVSEVLKKPAALLAEATILQTVLRGSSDPRVSSERAQLTRTRRSVAWMQASRVITEPGDFRRQLVASFKAAGLPQRIAPRIHAAVSAGLMPVVAGPRALLALEAYARVACGGRLFHIHVTPPFLEPADLLGKVDSARARFLPHPDSLIDILETASKATGLACVILEGINRAPTESYLLPVLQCALGKRSLRLFHPAAVAADDPYCDFAELQWPSNVFISATLIEGPTTLPVSRDLWSMAALIDTDGSAPSALPSPWHETTELDPESSLVKPSEPLSDLVDDMLEDWPEYGSFRDVFGRFFNALAPFESDRDKREGALVESLLLPLIASLDDEEDRYKELQRVKVRDLTGTDLLEPAVLVHRMRRRIA